MVDPQDFVERKLRETYERSVRRTAERLREAADEVERRGLDVRLNLSDLKPSHVAAARSVLVTITNMMPSLGLDAILRDAESADRDLFGGAS